VANPYKDTLLHLLPTGTFTLQDTPSLSRRDKDCIGFCIKALKKKADNR